jgi:hypothetical protein
MSAATIFVDIDGVFHDVRHRAVDILPGCGRLRRDAGSGPPPGALMNRPVRSG